MKKLLFVLCAFLCVLLIVCFSACEASVEETTAGNTADESTSDSSTDNTENTENTEVVIALSSDLTEVSPGEEFTVTATVKESRMFAAGDLIFSFDKKLMTAEFVEESVSSVYSFSNEIENGYQYSGYVASTANLENAVLFTVYCAASEDCKTGDEIKITLSCDEWLIGLDENGDELKSLADFVTAESLVIKIK